MTVARRFLGIIADNAVNTYFMLVMGEGARLSLASIFFVTFGNGFRFGRLYLHVSQALSLIGFSIVLFFSPFWSLPPCGRQRFPCRHGRPAPSMSACWPNGLRRPRSGRI